MSASPVGSSFASFLAQEGIQDSVEADASRRVEEWQEQARKATPAKAYPIAARLAEIGPTWSEVAVREQHRGDHDRWAWHLSWQDEFALRRGRSDGAYTTAQQRRGAQTVLLARRVER